MSRVANTSAGHRDHDDTVSEFDPAEFEGGEEGQKIPVLSDSRQKSRVAHTLAYSKFRGNVKQ
jgi:hypothetical protein